MRKLILILAVLWMALMQANATTTNYFIVVPVQFSDLSNGISYTTINTAMTNASDAFSRYSYGSHLMSWSIYDTITLPFNKQHYIDISNDSGNNEALYSILADVKNYYSDLGYDVFPVINTIVLALPGNTGWFQSAGVSDGGSTIFINGGSFKQRILVHEMGHDIGCFHPHTWQSTAASNNPADFSKGHTGGYDVFDVMGYDLNDSNKDKVNYAFYYKYSLGWIPTANYANVAGATNTTYKIYASDASNTTLGSRKYGIRIPVSTYKSFFVSYRRAYPANNNLSNGLYVSRGNDNTGFAFYENEPVDWTPHTPSITDLALPLNTTMTEPVTGTQITPTSQGSDANGEFINVHIVR